VTLVKRNLSKIGLIAVGVLLLLGAGGCGGGGSSEATLTKKQFLSQAESICQQAEKQQLQKATKYLQENPGAEEQDAVIPAGLPPIEEELTKLETLGLPKGGEAEIEAFLQALGDALEKAKEDPESVLVQQGNPFGKPNKVGSKYGLKACAANP
jgi:hypothetical protein